MLCVACSDGGSGSSGNAGAGGTAAADGGGARAGAGAELTVDSAGGGAAGGGSAGAMSGEPSDGGVGSAPDAGIGAAGAPPSSAGAAGAASSGAAENGAGAAGTGGASDERARCDEIVAEYVSSFSEQLTCTPGAGDQCQDRIEAPGCDCLLFIEPKDPFAIEQLTNVYIDWLDADCDNASCPGSCPSGSSGTCGADGRCSAAP